ncbi:MAG: hypothetical protein H3C68_02230 [Deltaproteobacteria bacterium]|nr:hypothetical protein [Deltaproteobacteria bacterium]MBZ0218926.1 hypothetical protein [Deltaproteobacteria bacterium]
MARKDAFYAAGGPAWKAGTISAPEPAQDEAAAKARLDVIEADFDGPGPARIATGMTKDAAAYKTKGTTPIRGVELIGTSIGDTGQASAFFLNIETGEREGFHIGDSVFGAGVLRRIEPDSAVIETGDGEFALTLHRAAPPDGKRNEMAGTPECGVYLLAQSLSTYNSSKYGAISTVEEADAIFTEIKGRVDGVEYETLFYSTDDLRAHREIAGRAKSYGIELWATSWRLIERIRAFVRITPEYQARRMLEDGTIVPAEINGRPLFDVLNREAVSHFLAEYERKYLEPFKGLLDGYFFNEDVLVYFGERVRGNNYRFDYWNNPTYSHAVLKDWKEYCRRNNVTFDGRLVERFPVHRTEMVQNGGGLTSYFPGYNVPEVVRPGQPFSGLPRAEGVWKHWQKFTTALFQSAWIDQVAALANEVNADNPEWKGVIYFGLHQWSLSYESIEDKDFTVPSARKWGAWGMQRGVDLEKMAASPHIDAIICETYPPVSANIEFYVNAFKKIAEKNGKRFGVMLHRDDDWEMDMREERMRWKTINDYSPSIVARYPLKNMLPWDKNFSGEAESLFERNLEQYRENRCASARR